MDTTINWRDLAERCWWTFVAALLATAPSADLLFDVAAWKGAIVAGVVALVNAVLLVARYRLSFLKTPTP